MEIIYGEFDHIIYMSFSFESVLSWATISRTKTMRQKSNERFNQPVR